MSEITYGLVAHPEDQPIDEIVIESRGHVNTFTLGEMKENVAKAEKFLKEVRANKDVQESVMKNVSEHNPFILEMSDEKLHACHMYFDAKALRNTYSDKEKSCEEYLAAEALDLAEVLKQLPELNTPKNV